MRVRARRAGRLAVLVAVAAGAYLAMLPPAPHRLSLPQSYVPPSGLVRGAFHVHTDRSDGSGSVDAIAEAAAAAGLHFVIFTDHGDGTRPPDAPTYRSGVLRIDAVEISADGGHYIAVGLPRSSPYPLGGEAGAVVEDVRRLGGFGVVAHPTSPKAALAWANPALPVDGFEWLNGDSEWRNDSWWALSKAASAYVVRPASALASLLDRPDRALEWWNLASGRRLVGVGGADVHARLALRRGSGGEGEGYDHALEIPFPGYEQVFRTFSLWIELDRPWSGEPSHDAAALLRALRAGRVFTAVDALATPVVFRFVGRVDGREVSMGARVESPSPVEFLASTSNGLPPDAALVLLRNGQVVEETAGIELRHVATRPGTYRVEARLPRGDGRSHFPWIVSNPIYMGPEPPRRPPDSGFISRRDLALTAFSAREQLQWVTESDPSSQAQLAPEGDDGIRFSYELGDVGAGVYAAAVYPVAVGALSRFDRLIFDARADQPHRVSIQLRASQAPGQPRWRRSRYIGPTAESVVVPFSELVGVDVVTPGEPLRLAQIDAILVVVDSTNKRPGGTGDLSIGRVRLEGS